MRTTAVALIASLLASCMEVSPDADGANASIAEGESPISFPEDFFVNKISAPVCQRHGSGSFESQMRFTRGILGQSKWSNQGGTSLTVNHDELSTRWASLLDLSFDAALRESVVDAQAIIRLLVLIAQEDFLMETPTLRAAQARGNCWKGGDKNSDCPYHTPQHASFSFVAFLISAIVLEEFMNAEERRILDEYFSKAYRKYVKPLADSQLDAKGIYEFADMGIGVLAYARWKRDHQLAMREIVRRKSAFMRRIESNGFIDNNSYRGNRGYWYHTHGAENVFGFSMLSREFGVDFFQDNQFAPKLSALATATVDGSRNIKEFESAPDRGRNASKDAQDARPHVIQLAINLPEVLQREFGLTISTQERYDRLSSRETVSRLIGFNADCYYRSR